MLGILGYYLKHSVNIAVMSWFRGSEGVVGSLTVNICDTFLLSTWQIQRSQCPAKLM